MKSKITKFDAKKPFQGKTSAFVTFEDESWGFFEYKGDAPFKEGDEVEYTAVKEKTKTGKDIVKLTINKIVSETPQKEVQTETEPTDLRKEPSMQNKFSPSAPKSIEEYKVNAAIESLRFVMDAFSVQRIDEKQIEEYQKRGVTLLWDEIDEIFNGKK